MPENEHVNSSIENAIGEDKRNYLCKWHNFHWEIEESERRGDR